MAGSESKAAVALALAGNSFLTVLKFTAFGFSGSGSMFSEAMHSMADTANQFLLFIGIRRSEKPADAMFSYGYGGERFLFALLSAVGIFVLGCGVTVYHGISTLIDPHELEPSWIDFTVLGISFVVDFFVLWKAYKAVNKARGDKPFFKFLRTTTDPTVSAVLLEDGVACVGVLVATIGIILSMTTGIHAFDAAGSITIGLLLGFVAVFLGYQNRSLILGRTIPKPAREKIIEYLKSQETVESVRAVQSRIVGADSFALKAEVDWNGRVLGARLEGWVKENSIKDGKESEFAAEFGEQMTGALAQEIDRIETELRELVPELTFLDFESD